MFSALEQVKSFTYGMKVHVIHTGEDGMPFYFLEDAPMGCAPYADYDEFNPFKILGFTVVEHHLEPTEEQDGSGELPSRFAAAIEKAESFHAALEAVKKICPGLPIRSE